MTASAAVAAVRTASADIFFGMETYDAVTAVAGFYGDPDYVRKQLQFLPPKLKIL